MGKLIPRLGLNRDEAIAREVFHGASAIHQLLSAAALLPPTAKEGVVLRDFAASLVASCNPLAIGKRLDAETAEAEAQQKKWEEQTAGIPPLGGIGRVVHAPADPGTDDYVTIMKEMKDNFATFIKQREEDDRQRIAPFPLFLLGFLSVADDASFGDSPEKVATGHFARKHLGDERFPLDGEMLSDFRNYLDETNQRDDNDRLTVAWDAFIKAEEAD